MLTYSYTALWLFVPIYCWLLDKYHSQFIEYQKNKQCQKISKRKICAYTRMSEKWGLSHRNPEKLGHTYTFYTPDIRSMWGYIVFAFRFVCSFVRSFVRSFVFPSQGQSFCIKVYKTSYFEDPLMDFIHIWHDGRYRSKFLSAPSPPRGWPWGQGHRLRIFIKK